MIAAAPAEMSPLEVARLFVRSTVGSIREDAAAIEADPLALAHSAARVLALEVLRARERPCPSMRCAGDGLIGDLTVEQRRAAHRDPVRYAGRCGPCIDRVVGLDSAAAEFWHARGCEACNGADGRHLHLATPADLERLQAAAVLCPEQHRARGAA